MRFLVFAAAASVAAMLAQPAAAQVQIRNAAMRVTIIPEARADISVALLAANPRMHVTVQRFGERVIVNGGLGLRDVNCAGERGVTVMGMGFVPYQDLPQLIVRTPLDAKVSAGGAVFGVVGRSGSLDLQTSGCGDWTVANVAGAATIKSSGSGDVRAGSAGSASVHISGSADVFFGRVANGLDVADAGSGDVHVEDLAGPMHVRVAGSGDVLVARGAVGAMNVAVAGSGEVRFGGTAQSLDATVAGSGDVVVNHVSGQVTRRVVGSGEVSVGH